MDGLVLTAAGSSTRMGGATGKVFLDLVGQPVWARALAPFLVALPGLAVVVTARAEDLERVRAGGLPVTVVLGGATRQQSVARGLAALPTEVEHVLVHDAARPLASADLVRRVYQATRRHGAALPGLPVGDSLHEVAPDGASLVRPHPRAALLAAQTPQGARADWLRDALARAEAAGVEATDEAGLLLWAGRAVHVVEGEPSNLKLTRRDDLRLAECLLADARRAGQA